MGNDGKELLAKSVEEWQKKACQSQPKIEKISVVVTVPPPPEKQSQITIGND